MNLTCTLVSFKCAELCQQLAYGKLFKTIRKQLQLDDVEDGDLTDISKESECVDDDAKTIVAEFDYQRKNYFIR